MVEAIELSVDDLPARSDLSGALNPDTADPRHAPDNLCVHFEQGSTADVDQRWRAAPIDQRQPREQPRGAQSAGASCHLGRARERGFKLYNPSQGPGSARSARQGFFVARRSDTRSHRIPEAASACEVHSRFA